MKSKLLLILFCFVGCVLCAIGIKQNVAAIHELRQEQAQTTVTQTTPIIVVVEPEQPTRAYFNIPLPYNVQDHIFDECDKYNVDPAIVVALINRESKFNDYAIGDDGRSFGLMQIQAKWHLQRMIKLNCTNLFDQYQNITVEKNIAPPSSHICLIRSLRVWLALGSSPTKGSSIIISLGAWISAEIIASFCFIP